MGWGKALKKVAGGLAAGTGMGATWGALEGYSGLSGKDKKLVSAGVGGGQYGAYGAYAREMLRDKRGQTHAHENSQDRADRARRALGYQDEIDKLDTLQSGQDADRTKALAAFDGSLSDPGFQQELDQGYYADMNNAMAGLDEQYRGASQQQGLRAAKRGVMGGSTDAEQQADLGSQFQLNAMGATNAALGRRSALANSRKRSQSSFRRSILTGDPAQAAQYQSMAANENQMAQRQADTQDFMQAFGRLRSNGNDDLSQLYGGLLGTGAKSYYNTYSGLEG